MNYIKNYFLFFVIFASLCLRIWGLGDFPEGVSSSEAVLGTYFSTTNIFLIRLPFAIIGVVTIYLIYFICKKLTSDERLSLATSFAVAISPLHIFESRIFSEGIVFTFLVLVILSVFWRAVGANYGKISLSLLTISLTVFVASVFVIPEDARNAVDYQRNIASEKMPIFLTKVFSNKLVESYKEKEKNFFENIDFGYYFSAGYPRPRWGIEEYQKLFYVFLPLGVIGAVTTKRKYVSSLFLVFLSYCLIIAAFGLRAPTWGLSSLFLFAPLIAKGFVFLIEKRVSKILLVFLGAVFLYEFGNFWSLYKNNLAESQFSPRTVIFEGLTRVLADNLRDDDSLFVDPKLADAEKYFEFYNPRLVERLGIGAYTAKEVYGRQKIFVGMLPYDASPAEALYKKDGEWPEYIDVIEILNDKKLKREIVVFRSKL